MNARLLMHIRELPSGPGDRHAGRLREPLGRRRRRRHGDAGGDRAGRGSGCARCRARSARALAEPVDAELDSITVDLARRKGAKPVPVTVGARRRRCARRRPGRSTSSRRRSSRTSASPLASATRPGSKAQKEIREAFEHWDLDAVLSCDDTGASRLELVEVPFPPPSEGDDTDDGFVLEAAADDLTALAAAGRLSRFDGRDALVERVLVALGARDPRERHARRARRTSARRRSSTRWRARLAAGDVPAPLAGQAALAHLGERADRRGALHGHVAGPGARPDLARPRGGDLRDGRSERRSSTRAAGAAATTTSAACSRPTSRTAS